MPEAALTLRLKAEDTASQVLQLMGRELETAGNKASATSPHFARLSEAASGLANGAKNALSPLKDLGSHLSSVGTIAAGMIAGNVMGKIGGDLAGAFKDGISATKELGSQVKTMSREMGTSAEQSSDLLFAMKRFGIEGETGEKMFIKFGKGLQGVQDAEDGVLKGGKTTSQILKDMGVSAEDSHGKMKPFNDIMLETSDAFKAMPDGVEKTVRATQLFGKTGADMLPMLNLGRQGLEESAAMAKKYGFELSGSNIDSITAFGKAHKELGFALDGVKLQLGVALMPILANAAKTFGEVGLNVFNAVKSLFMMLDPMTKLAPLADILGTVFGKLKDMVIALAKGDANSFFLALSQGAGKLGLDVSGLQDKFLQVTAFLFGTVPQAFEAARVKVAELSDLFMQRFGPQIQQVSAFLQQHMDVIARVAGVLLLMANPVTAVATAVVGLGLAWTQNWGDIQGKTQAVWSVIQPVFESIKNAFSIFWEQIWPDLEKFWNNVTGATDMSMGEGGGILGKIRHFMGIIQAFWAENWTTIQTVFGVIMAPLVLAAETIGTLLSGTIRAFMKIINGDWSGAWDVIKETATTELDNVKQYLGTILPAFAQAAGSLGNALLHGIIDALTGLGTALATAFTSALNSININLGPFHLSASGFKIDTPAINLPGSSGGGGGHGNTYSQGALDAAGGDPNKVPGVYSGGYSDAPGTTLVGGAGAAMGTDFVVGGAGGLDDQLIPMRLQPGEHVTVTPGGGSGPSRQGGSVNVNVSINGPVVGSMRQLAQEIYQQFLQMQNSQTTLGFK